MSPRSLRILARALAGVTVLASPGLQARPPATAPVVELRVVGGLAEPNQYTRQEEPFWSQRLPSVSAGRLRTEIVPFDRAGLRSTELLGMVQSGAVSFATVLLSTASARDLELDAADLPGQNPDMASLRRLIAAYRGHLQQVLRQRHMVELLAVYTYPAQALFCTRPLSSLADLKGRRVRTSGLAQADWVEAWGATPVTTTFAQVVPQVRAGNLDCAITGTMSGHTIGLDQLTSHLHTLPVTWGLSVFVANGKAWQALPADVRTLLQRELPLLEQSIWDAAERETAEGIACSTGQAVCSSSRKGRMVAVHPTAADIRRQRSILAETVLPRWLQRCGPTCLESWNRWLAPLAAAGEAMPAAFPAATPAATAPPLAAHTGAQLR